jgi:hypothetical protein
MAETSKILLRQQDFCDNKISRYDTTSHGELARKHGELVSRAVPSNHEPLTHRQHARAVFDRPSHNHNSVSLSLFLNNIATMLRSIRPRRPADVYNIDDRVTCNNPRSKHYGHTARIIGMGKARLHVEFDHGHVGKFLDWRDVEIFTPLLPATPATQPDIGQLTTLLEHMAFTAATVISSEHGDSQNMENLLTSFDRQVRDHANALAATRQSPRNARHASQPNDSRVPPDEF